MSLPSERDLILSRCALWVRLAGRITRQEWDLVADYVHEHMMADLPDAGSPDLVAPDLESGIGEIPSALLLRLGVPLPFKDVPVCEQCGRHAIFPPEEVEHAADDS